MVEIALGLYQLLAAGLLGLAAKYAFGPVPASPHRLALEQSGTPLTPTLRVLIRAIYRPMRAAFAAFAVLLIALALGPVADGERWGSLAATGVSFVLGIPTTFGTWTFERRTGIRAPYRLSAAMKGLSVVAMARSW